MIIVSTDGSALSNPHGPMGWAWADHHDQLGDRQEHHHSGDSQAGGATNGTNQIGELCAVLQALRTHPGNEPLTIETDSQYAINCATTWIHGWKKNGWKNSKKEPVKNASIIRAIDQELTKRPGKVTFVWVKGHAGNAGNEKVDELARTYATDCRTHAKEGYLPREGWEALLDSEYAQGLDIPQDAKMLLQHKITDIAYQLGRSNGEDVNPDFHTTPDHDNMVSQDSQQMIDTQSLNATDCEVKNSPQHEQEVSESTYTPSRETMHETSTDVDHLPLPMSSNTQSTQPVSGLHVSGTLQFSPPPSTSPTFDGKPRYIRGTISVEGYVQADGTLHIDRSNFYLQ